MRIRIFAAAGITALSLGLSLALSSAPAFAQQKNVPKYGDEDKPKTRSEIEEEKAKEQSYKRALGNIPAKADTDPWAAARSSDSATAAKAAKPATPPKPKPAKPATAAN